MFKSAPYRIMRTAKESLRLAAFRPERETVAVAAPRNVNLTRRANRKLSKAERS